MVGDEGASKISLRQKSPRGVALLKIGRSILEDELF